MYDVWVLNNNFETVGIIDYYISLIWTERYLECGDFELTLKSDSNVFDFISVGYYLWMKGAKMTMIIEKIEVQTNVEDGNELILSGRSLESILDRRIIWPQITLKDNTTLQDGVKELINSCFISPEWDADSRKVSNFRFIDSDDADIASLELKAQYTGDNLYEVISSICNAYDLGFRIVYNDDENTFDFSLYKGQDRSYDQTKLPYVVFSKKFDNLIGSNYLESDENLKTLTIVAGEGEGTDRETVTVVSSLGAGFGLSRRELFTDAKDVSKNKNKETELTDAQYRDALNQKGVEKLAGCVPIQSFEGEVENGQTFAYERDYFMGDIVQLRNEYGKEGIVRVIELIRSIDSSGFEVYPTFLNVYKATITIFGNIGDTVIVSGTGYGYDVVFTRPRQYVWDNKKDIYVENYDDLVDGATIVHAESKSLFPSTGETGTYYLDDSKGFVKVVVTKTGSYVFYGKITGVQKTVSAETYSLEYTADTSFDANLNIITNVGAIVHLLSDFGKSFSTYMRKDPDPQNPKSSYFPEKGEESKIYLDKSQFDLYEWKKIKGSNPEQFEYSLVPKVAADDYSYWDWGKNDFISLYYTATASEIGVATASIVRTGSHNLLSSLGPDDDNDKTIALSTIPKSYSSIITTLSGETLDRNYVYVWAISGFTSRSYEEKKIIEYSTRSKFPDTGKISKYYKTLDTEKYYTWEPNASGTGGQYKEMAASDINKPSGDGDYQTRDVQIYFDDPFEQTYDHEDGREYIHKDHTKYYTGAVLYVSTVDYPLEPDSRYTLVGDIAGTGAPPSPVTTKISPDIGYKIAFKFDNVAINQEYRFSCWPYLLLNGVRYYGEKYTTSFKLNITAVSISIKQQPEGARTCIIYWDKPKTLYTGIEIYVSDDIYPDTRRSDMYEKLVISNNGRGDLIDLNSFDDDDSIDLYDGWIEDDNNDKDSNSGDGTDYKYALGDRDHRWTISEEDTEKTFYFSAWTFYDLDGTRYYSQGPSKTSYRYQPKKPKGNDEPYDGWIEDDDDNE